MQRPHLKISTILSALILAVFFILFTFPIADGDCFWHLATGRWIVENRTLPSSDPLSFTVTDHSPWKPGLEWIPFVLKQYWLGQLVLFGTWKLMGTAGIVLLRAITYTAIMALLLAWMRRTSRGITPFVLVVLTGFMLREFPNERPQLFSFLFMPLTLYLLERISERSEEWRHKGALVALPIVMLVWANTHGAYILGVVLIFCYLLLHLLSCLRHNTRPDRFFFCSLVAAGMITCVNPNGIIAWKVYLLPNVAPLITGAATMLHKLTSTVSWQEPAITNAVSSDNNYEYLTPWHAAIQLHDWYPAYWIGILLAIGGFIRCRTTFKPVHLVVMVSLIGLSLTGLRYIVFPLLAAPLFVRYLPTFPVHSRTVSLLVLSGAVWLGFTWNSNFFEFNERWKFPAGAAAFVHRQAPEPNCFSHYDWGGYLALTVPGFKTFIDGRCLVQELIMLYDKSLKGEAWQKTFDTYAINTVIMPGMSETSGNIYPLVDALTASSNWHVVFSDENALVFVRDIPANKKLIARFAMDKLSVQIHLVRLADRLIAEDSKREEYWQTKANALQLLGDRKAALAAYRRTLQLNPNNTWAQRMLSASDN